MNERLAELHEFALAIAPELADGFPLYLVECPPEWLPHDCIGGHMSWIDPLWVKRLQDSGAWQGNGRLITVAESATRLPFEYLAGVVTHELAHATPATMPAKLFAPTAENVALCQKWANDDAAQGVDDFPGGSAEMHGQDFVRRLIHLRHRAERYGLAIPWDAFGVRHGQRHVSMMARALGDEPIRLIDATFQEIEQTAPPAAYSALWQTGVRP